MLQRFRRPSPEQRHGRAGDANEFERLMAMTDGELADIGLRRGDIEAWGTGQIGRLRRRLG